MIEQNSPLAYLNGTWILQRDFLIPPTDSGFVLGTTVAEQMRTFQGRVFRLAQHIARLKRSLAIVGVELPMPFEALAEAAEQLAKHNHRLLQPDDDLGLTLFVTPGPYLTYVPSGGPPLVGMHTYPLPFRNWVHLYRNGQSVIVTSTRQVPSACWPPELKCRSRMHFYLADREARQHDPAARAILLDLDGFVTEASTANVVLWRAAEGLISPPRDHILPGISVTVLEELAGQLAIPFVYRPIRPQEIESSEEVFLTSTSPCLVPVTRCNGKPIGSGRPGPVFEKLMAAWNQLVGIDIRAQAEKYANRPQ